MVCRSNHEVGSDGVRAGRDQPEATPRNPRRTTSSSNTRTHRMPGPGALRHRLGTHRMPGPGALRHRLGTHRIRGRPDLDRRRVRCRAFCSAARTGRVREIGSYALAGPRRVVKITHRREVRRTSARTRHHRQPQPRGQSRSTLSRTRQRRGAAEVRSASADTS